MSLYKAGFTQNRELSWLTYNERVMEEAVDETVPLFERLKYIAIFMKNLEEFIQVRVGGLIGEDEDGDDEIDQKSGMTAGEQLNAIYAEIARLLHKKDRIHHNLEKRLYFAGLERVTPDRLSKSERIAADNFFKKKIKKKLRYRMVSKVKEFPFLNQDVCYIVSRLDAENKNMYSIVEIPNDIPKILVLDKGIPGIGEFSFEGRISNSSTNHIAKFRYILTADIIKQHVSDLVDPFETVESHIINIARNADIKIDKPSKDILKNMKELSIKRKHAAPDKLIIDGSVSNVMGEYLINALCLDNSQTFMTRIIDYSFVDELENALPDWLVKSMCFPEAHPFNPMKLGYGSMIERLKRKEYLCAYPYETMDPFLNLLKEAATDKRVMEIRMTIYRLSSQPQIVEYLKQAARKGKKVTVVMELRARFDEENNIDWSKEMRKHGIKVCFGYEKYKIHSKLAQIVLVEDGRKAYITHLSTGNFNEKTASQYTDLALITYDQRIGIAANALWEDIINDDIGIYMNILTSPRSMKPTIIEYIRREANKGSKGFILIKVNAITDEELIAELMKASCAGCTIRMIVRGICCILPEIKGYTENIAIVNVVGRYLEHSRVYIFGSDEDEVMFISSADFMTRNMSKRVELACPIYSKENRNKIKNILMLNYNDNVKGRILGPDGKYYKKKIIDKKIDSQQELMELFG